ncbi:MAG: MocR-like pyridoxine biosynthesis transcription factor PdxR [Rhodanobacter sp.]
MKLDGVGPIYQQVYNAIRQGIEDGRFRIDTRLPGSRSMAAGLGVSRTVALMAYERLESEGYIRSLGGSGTYVSATRPSHADAPAAVIHESGKRPPEVPLSALAGRTALPEPGQAQLSPDVPCPAGTIDLTVSLSVPDTRSLDQWRHGVAELLRRRSSPDFPAVAGVPELRAAVTAYLQGERGIDVDPQDVIIVSGSQQARDLIARLLVDEGTVVGVEEPCYWGVRHTYAAAGARVVPCTVDARGLDVSLHADNLEDARVVHVTPSYQFPTGAVMPVARREALLRWAYARQVYLVEDDYDCEHRFGVRATPALWGMDRYQRVIYTSSFARVMYPALQLGYMVVPPGLREKFLAIKWLADRGSMSMQQHALAGYIGSGEYLRGLRRVAHRLSPRYHVLREALKTRLCDEVEMSSETAGNMLFVALPGLPHAATGELLAEALACGLRVRSGEHFYMDKPSHVTLALHYAAVSEPLLKQAAARLAEACSNVAARRHGREPVAPE